MRHAAVILGLLLAAPLPAWAQGPRQDSPLEPPAQEIPPLPGNNTMEGGETPPINQTPPEQETIVPEPEEPAQPDTIPPSLDNSLEPPQQPEFDRDAVPRSTEPERELERPQENVVPDEQFDNQATGGTRPDVTNPDILPGPDPDVPEVDPDAVPDRRFETFETQYDGGTPPLPVPKQAPKKQGAAPDQAPM